MERAEKLKEFLDSNADSKRKLPAGDGGSGGYVFKAV
jgi:hypothetical protein